MPALADSAMTCWPISIPASWRSLFNLVDSSVLAAAVAVASHKQSACASGFLTAEADVDPHGKTAAAAAA